MKNWQILLLFHVCWFILIYLLFRINEKSDKVLERLNELEKKIESSREN
jgi:hypothetical protein